MELILAIVIAVLTGTGIYLLLRARTFPVVMGLTLFTYAVNLFLFAMGRIRYNAPPVTNMADVHTAPLPQALVLTAIVIGFAMTAFVVVLSLRARADLGNDHVDGVDKPKPELEQTKQTEEANA